MVDVVEADEVEADEVEADEVEDDDFFRFFPLLGLFFISLSCFFLALVSAAMSATRGKREQRRIIRQC